MSEFLDKLANSYHNTLSFLSLCLRSEEKISVEQMIKICQEHGTNFTELRTYDGWEATKRHVNKGEHGFGFYDDINSPYKSKINYVFDVKQTKGLPRKLVAPSLERFEEVFGEIVGYISEVEGKDISNWKESLQYNLKVRKENKNNDNNAISERIHRENGSQEKRQVRFDDRTNYGDGRVPQERGNQSVGGSAGETLRGRNSESGQIREDGSRDAQGRKPGEVLGVEFAQNDISRVGGFERPSVSDEGRTPSELETAQGNGYGSIQGESSVRSGETPRDRISDLQRDNSTVRDGRFREVAERYAQFSSVAQAYSTAIVFVRVGDFYETYDNNAKTCSNELGLVLTSRSIDEDKRIPMVGIPYHATDKYIEKLLDKHTVIVLEADKEPKLYPLKEKVEPAPIVIRENENTQFTVEEKPLKKKERTIKERKKKTAQFSLFDLMEEKTESSFEEEIIAKSIKRGSGFENGKMRICFEYEKNPTTSEFANFLKDEYGIGGGGGDENVWSDSKGLQIQHRNHETREIEFDKLLSWNDVATRIADLIDEGTYLTEEEQAQYENYRAQRVGTTEERAKAIAEWMFARGMKYKRLWGDKNKYDHYNHTDNRHFVKEHTKEIIEELKKYDKVNDVIDNNGELTVVFNEVESANEVVAESTEERVSDTVETVEQTQTTEVVEVVEEKPLEQVDENYVMTDYDFTPRSPKTRAQDNIVAIELLQTLALEHRKPTEEEKQQLAFYCGWGGLADVFDERKNDFLPERTRLKEILSEKEYESAKATVTDAHYTSKDIIDGIYAGLKRLGVKNASVLEPSCGTGNFIGNVPSDMSLTFDGIEIDGLTASISSHLYPKAKIKNSGFEEVKIENDTYDVVVGNVPFGNFRVCDDEYNKHRFIIHDYFLAKSIDKLRAGGIMAVITGKGTLDKKDDRARKYICERAELVGAFRLPNNAFKSNAGTEVVADVLFFKKRPQKISEEEFTAQDRLWLETTVTHGDVAPLNNYFIENDGNVLGETLIVSGPFGKVRTVKATELDLRDQLTKAMGSLPENVYESVAQVVDETPSASGFTNEQLEEMGIKNYSLCLVGNRAYVRNGNTLEELDGKKMQGELSGKTLESVKAYIKLRDITRKVIEMQSEGCTDDELKIEQWKLESVYDDFVKKFGYVCLSSNRSKLDSDIDYPLVSALEEYNEEEKTATKARIFFERTIRKTERKTHTDDVMEALTLCKNEFGEIDLHYIETLTGLTHDKVVEQLKEEIFPTEFNDNGESAQYTGYVSREEYLSGNVVEKLKEVELKIELLKNKDVPQEEKAKRMVVLEHNANALRQVQPKKLTAGEISAKVGATWIDTDDYRQFLAELVGDGYGWKSYGVEYNPYTGKFSVKSSYYGRHNARSTNTYGTNRMCAPDIFECLLNSIAPTIYDKVEDFDGKEKHVVNKVETAMVRQKAKEIEQEFEKWIWAHPVRIERYEKRYNDLFNSTVLPSYNGEFLQFPEMNNLITLRKHQLDAIARITTGKNTLLHHSVGAGKTYEIIASAMKLRQYGIAHKPAVIVPKPLVSQWAREIKMLYPTAKILVATDREFEKKNRQRFISKIATGDWDLVVMAQSQFEKIKVSPQRQLKKMKDVIDEIERAIWSRGDVSVKRLEQTLKVKKTKYQELLANLSKAKDEFINFEQLGIDYLFVDEAHAYKNKEIETSMQNVAGISKKGSQRAFDMEMKIDYIGEVRGGDKGVVFATGTPISNSMAEMFTMQSYLGKRELQRVGLEFFDGWAKTFGEVVNTWELSTTGNGVKPRSRFARFVNLPELQKMYREFADVKTSEMLNLPVPSVNRHVIDLPATEQVKRLNDEIIARGQKIEQGAVEPWEDNMLVLTTDGKKMALDPRCMDAEAEDDEGSKVNECVRNVYDIYERTTSEKLTQVIFCDQSTPKTGTWSVYSDIKEKLIALGVPEEEIAFVHDAHNDTQKANLFNDVGAGKVRILLGSTQKCGTGANFQTRLKALHHLDVPYRPSDMEQREGRIIRQGNTNSEVDIYCYITQKTFDAYSYQLLESKQRFISQINKGDLTLRSATDIDETTFSFAQIKAIATANPDFLRQMELINTIKELKMLKSKHYEEQDRMRKKVSHTYPTEIATYKKRLELVTVDAQKVEKPEKLSITLLGNVYDERSKAGDILTRAYSVAKHGEVLGEYAGMQIKVNKESASLLSSHKILLCGNTEYSIELGESELGNITRIENAYANIPGVRANLEEKIKMLEHELEEVTKNLDKPFGREQELFACERELEKIEERLKVNEETVVDDNVEETESKTKNANNENELDENENDGE